MANNQDDLHKFTSREWIIKDIKLNKKLKKWLLINWIVISKQTKVNNMIVTATKQDYNKYKSL